MKKIIFIFMSGFVLAALGSAQVRTGEISRGIFHQEGIASWYGAEFNGRSTASGEIFNDSQYTAAHPILPFGTMLKITNQHNNKTVTVRVNDRGPFVTARIIDLSRAAAQELDMIATGTAPVTVESLSEVSLPARPDQKAAAPVAGGISLQSAPFGEPGETIQVRPASVELFSDVSSRDASQNNPIQTLPPVSVNAAQFHPAIPAVPTGKYYQVQVGAYKQPQYAIEAFEKLKKAGFNPAYERYGDYCRVVLKGLKQEDLRAVSERLGSAGFREVLLKEER